MQKEFNFRTFFAMFVFMITFFFTSIVSAYSFTWDAATGTLTINATNQNGETIVVCVCSGGAVTINGIWLKDGFGNDVLIYGNIVNKLIVNGGSGNDIIDLVCVNQTTFPNLAKTGEEFRVQVNGGAGNDDIDGSKHSDLINGGDGDDYVGGDDGEDEINGGAGEDELYGCGGDDKINGDAGHDYIEGEAGNDTIHGGDGDDEIFGGSDEEDYETNDNDKLYGDDGDDYIFGDCGADEIYGGAGNDQFDIDFDDTITDGGAGNDRLFSPLGMFTNDLSFTPKTLSLADSEGEDELDFSLSSRGLKLNLDLLGTNQAINNFGYNLKLNGQFENLTGTDQDDEITLKALPGFTRNIVCGLQLDKDVLNFDAEQKIVINTGYALTCEGVNLVLHEGFEEVNLINLFTDVGDNPEIPLQFSLNQNYPNPFNPTTTISYTLPEQSNVILKVYDALGSEIFVLINEEESAGLHKVEFNAAGLSSGIYYYKISAGNFSETKSMMLLK